MKTDVQNNHKLEEEFKEQLKMPFVITVCSGKGGVGKSFCAANLAYALSKQSLSVLIWDANLHYPNQHILFGVEPPVRLKEVYSGKKKVESAIYRIEDNLFILADQFASGKNHVLKSSEILDVYIDILQTTKFDIIIIDTPASDTEDVFQCCNIADLVCVVVTDEPTSLLDAYGLVKILLGFIDKGKIHLLVNNVIDGEDADDITEKMNLAAKKFLNVRLDVIGFIPYDRAVKQSILNQELYMMTNVGSEAVNSLIELSGKIKAYSAVFQNVK
ncbi:MAG: MinD/ParA family protein [Bacteroidetes bacterium]|nr:MAG: MinD/ParA family protein [Bacteroidota bacterium]